MCQRLFFGALRGTLLFVSGIANFWGLDFGICLCSGCGSLGRIVIGLRTRKPLAFRSSAICSMFQVVFEDTSWHRCLRICVCVCVCLRVCACVCVRCRTHCNLTIGPRISLSYFKYSTRSCASSDGQVLQNSENQQLHVATLVSSLH